MSKHSKESIISAYIALVKERGGNVVGEDICTRESGIARYSWNGRFWCSWSAFQADAGFAPNSPTLKIDDDTILHRFSELALQQNCVPTEADLILKRNQDPSFPGKLVFRRWGSRDALLAAVAEYCEKREQFAPVFDFLRGAASSHLDHRLDSCRVKGFVYLVRSGKYHKLGRTNAVGRRLRELAIQLPQKPNTVHIIETDDPEGIELYWHRRFAEKRQDGEWFALTPDDVRAFKKRRFQ